MFNLYFNNDGFEQRLDCSLHESIESPLLPLFSDIPTLSPMDIFNPESTVPLMDIPPTGYLVEKPVIDGEGDQPFACPHSSCDGFTFETVQECLLHDDDWHSPPYFCSECDTTFAAKPALKRHFNESGHFNWICLEENCDLKGFLFANQSEFLAHAMNTQGHQHLFLEQVPNSPTSVKRINYAEVTNLMEGETTEEYVSEEEGQQCSEPACRRYQRVFYGKSEFVRHQESRTHVNAVKYSEALQQSGKSVTEIKIEQEAARECRCTVQGCPKYGEKLTTAQSFYNHIQTAQHLYPLCVSTSDPASPTAEIRMKFAQINLSCDEPECPKFEYFFANKGNHTKHERSVTHQKAVEYGTMKRSMGNSGTGDEGKVEIQTPEKKQPAAIMAPPVTPQIWSRSSFTPISPAATSSTGAQLAQFVTPTKRPAQDVTLITPPSRREENLKTRNRELVEELERTKEKMDRMRAAYREQISSLFQILGETSDRSRQ